jgi:hypothetical protein
MSTRTSIVYVEETEVHLYAEMHDQQVYLQVKDAPPIHVCSRERFVAETGEWLRPYQR